LFDTLERTPVLLTWTYTVQVTFGSVHEQGIAEVEGFSVSSPGIPPIKKMGRNGVIPQLWAKIIETCRNIIILKDNHVHH
jgi:hypothetical protein